MKKNQCIQHTINQTCCHDGFVYNQPESFYHPNKKSSMCCRPDQKVKFQNESSTLQFPPSFNLRSDKKSTPKRTGNDSDSHLKMIPRILRHPILRHPTKNQLIFQDKAKQTMLTVEFKPQLTFMAAMIRKFELMKRFTLCNFV